MNGPTRSRRRSRRPVPSPDPVGLGTAGRTLVGAGRSNQAVLEQFDPGIPRLSYADLQRIIAESEWPIRAWLDDNVAYVRGLSLAAATAEAMRRVPEARQQGAGDVAGTVRAWAAERGIRLPARSIVPHPADTAPPSVSTGGDSELISAVRGAISTISEGVTVERGPAYARINASGATAGLREGGEQVSARVTPTGGVRLRAEGTEGFSEVTEGGTSIGISPRGTGVRVKAGVTWAGRLSFSGSVENFHFNMTMSAERWSMTLTFPSRQMPADLSQLGQVFGQGESALRQALVETAGVSDLSEIPDLADRLKPHIAPIRKAIKTAQRVAATKPGLSFGIRAQGPGPAVTPGGPEGVRTTSIQGVLTIVF